MTERILRHLGLPARRCRQRGPRGRRHSRVATGLFIPTIVRAVARGKPAAAVEIEACLDQNDRGRGAGGGPSARHCDVPI